MAIGSSFTTETELTTITCGSCAGVYAISERRRVVHYEEGTMWNCPYCRCRWGYPNDTEEKRLKRQIAQLETSNDQLAADAVHQRDLKNQAKHQARAHKGVATKLKNRAKAGMCPCCHRTFQQLKRHMDNQHPEYQTDG